MPEIEVPSESLGEQPQDELRRRHRELSVLYRISQANTTSPSMDKVLQNALDATLEALQIEVGSIRLLEPDGKSLTMRVHRGMTDESVAAIRTTQLGEGISGQAALTQQPRVWDVSDYPEGRLARVISQEKIRTLVSTPLLSAEGVVGTFTLATPRARAFPPDEMELLSAIGRQLGTVIHNARLLQTVQEELDARRRADARIVQLNHDLARRAIELENANKELEAFTYSVSHDLRAPLASIKSFAQLLMEENLSELAPDAQTLLRLIYEHAVDMDGLVQSLLQLAHLARQPLQKETIQPAELVQAALTDLLPLDNGRQAEIVIGNPAQDPPLPPCEGDPVLLKQVFANLLSNALKYTRSRAVAHIEIGCESCDETRFAESAGYTIAYFVRDNGVGFDMAQADKLFGAFQRLHSSEEYEGNGIGLAIVQRIIHRHGGRIWARAAVDQGATFYFTLG